VSVLDQLGDVIGRPLERRYEPARTGDVRDTWADIEMARRTLGCEPSTLPREGLDTQAAEVARYREAMVGRWQ
jgi:UDP-glucose 4-epimerase